jgi:phage major head subunit gpT-like protein
MPIPNLETLKIFDTMFSKAFADGLAKATDDYSLIATTIGSSTKINTYAWLGSFPRMREWIGDREIQGLADFPAYQLTNKKWELTIGVPRDDLEDDQYGLYMPIAEEMGFESRNHKTELVFSALLNGNAAGAICYDGKPFFAPDHPVKGAPVANFTAGGQPPWVLIDDTRPLKPIIFQNRRDPVLINKNRVDDDNMFWEDKAIWGMDARYVAGYGFWQLAHMSLAELTEDNFAAATLAMRSLKNNSGQRLNVRPTLLVVGPELEVKAKRLLQQVAKANGESNIMLNAVKLHVSNFFAA